MSDETYEHWYDYGPGSEASNRRTRETLKHAQDHGPGITCPACQEKEAEIARLRALVAVGRPLFTLCRELIRELRDHCDSPDHVDQLTELDLIEARWRSLEGK